MTPHERIAREILEWDCRLTGHPPILWEDLSPTMKAFYEHKAANVLAFQHANREDWE